MCVRGRERKSMDGGLGQWGVRKREEVGLDLGEEEGVRGKRMRGVRGEERTMDVCGC